VALAQVEYLQEDFLGWNDEYDMGYAQDQWDSQEELEEWVLEQCQKFIRGWRRNIEQWYGSLEEKVEG
jgi:hypothetical protein